ncbi:MAG: thioesterase family protein [Candidatus Planktophila sp.]
MQPAEDILGAVGFSVMTVRPGDTALAMGLSELPIVATSHLLHSMESATIAAISEYLDNGETTFLLGTSIELLGSAPVGVELRANARCTNIDGRELTFQCEIYDGERLIAQGEIKRATVERVTFLARTAAQELLKSSNL